MYTLSHLQQATQPRFFALRFSIAKLVFRRLPHSPPLKMRKGAEMTAILPTTYPKCETCEYWQDSGADKNRKGTCRLSRSERGYPLANLGILFCAQDYEQYKAFLETAPSFGCLLHSDLTEAGA